MCTLCALVQTVPLLNKHRDKRQHNDYSSTTVHQLMSIHHTGVTIGFVETLYAVKENDGSAVVTVAVLSGQLSQDVVINFDTQDGSAISKTDIHRSMK